MERLISAGMSMVCAILLLYDNIDVTDKDTYSPCCYSKFRFFFKGAFHISGTPSSYKVVE